MDFQEKLNLLGRSAEYDICVPRPALTVMPARFDLRHCVSTVVGAGGRCIRLLKVLLSNICENDCAYCAFRAGRDVPRAALQPAELASCFDQMYRAGLVEGLFLSSGICHHPVREMDRLIAAVEITRLRYQFRGYIHLKILPGAEVAQIERAARLANRISTNIEAPNPERLARLTRSKAFDRQLMPALAVSSRLFHASGGQMTPAGITTQFVVGAAGESDREILKTSDQLYHGLGLTRIYYSAFHPIPDTPLEDHPPTPALRELRLYQSDFLLRQYGFRFEELVFDENGKLPMEADPKTAWAKAHPERFPIEVNRADRPTLLRVPGIGPRAANHILQERRRGRLTDLSHLRKMGVRVERAAAYILLDGRRPASQFSLWE